MNWSKARTIIGFLWGLPIILFATTTCLSRLLIEVEGTIQDRTYLCQKPNNNRCVATYKIHQTEIGSSINFKANSNDPSLSQDLTVGTTLKKQRWQFGYFVNGKYRKDFPTLFYIVILLFGIFILCQGLIAKRRSLSF